MLDRILDLFAGGPRRNAGDGDLQTAVAALLVEAARMNDHFDDSERRTIRGLLARHFGLDAAAT
ncbi:MAG: TerB family tellurite resistance protein, partial [Alphaproteobacteria bacterium]|nr:TerB family tellurite resistance protein [Alphaproteobacteria bacterium]